MDVYLLYEKKEYDFNDAEPAHLEEFAVAYGLPQSEINFLFHLSTNDLDDAYFSGESLATLQKETRLTAKSMVGILAISKSKYYDLAKESRLDSRSLDALADFAALWKKGLEAFDSEQHMLNEWLQTKNQNLGNVKPVELLSSRLGRRELEKAFFRIEFSTYG